GRDVDERAGSQGVVAELLSVRRQGSFRATSAKTAAAEAARAATATMKIATEASAVAGEAQRAANAAAAHADAAAAAADEAAQHAGNAATAANTAQAAATAAGAAADSADASATQAHKVADIARASDQERLDAQQAAETAAADEASREAEQKARTAAWESGKAGRLAAETEQLVKDATAAGADPKAGVLKGRQAALRLLDSGGPWTRTAAQTALEGDESAVRAFLNATLTEARDRDDRTSIMAIAQGPTKLEQRLAAEAAAAGTAEQVRDFLATGQYPGKDDDDRVLLSQIMAAGGPGVKEAAGKALDGAVADVRAFLATGQYKARDDDNRVLVSQALASGGPEVKAAAQAVMSGPADRLEPFLQTGLPKARQRDAVTAAHVATVQSYLAAIDGSVALARQYAAEASQSYATARNAADEAAGYADQARASATKAADWSAKAAQSAQQAKDSATQAAGYARQAQASAASANTAASRASTSASMAAGYAAQARRYAATAKTAADQAQASAAAARKSAEEAAQAAKEAREEVWKKQQAETAAGQVQNGTAATDPDGDRQSFVEVQPRSDVTQEIVRQDMSKCVVGDPGLEGSWLFTWGSSPWHKNAAGQSVCDVKVTVKVTGTVDYVLKTCPEPNLGIEACKGKYGVWDTLVLDTKRIENSQYDTTIELSYDDYSKHYKVACGQNSGCTSVGSAKLLAGDFIQCFNNPDLASCGWAASTFLPVGALSKAAKGIVAFRFAILSGVGLDEAKLALQAALDGYSQATIGKLTAVADKVAKFRLTLSDGVGTDEALAALRNDAAVGHAVVQEMEAEAKIAKDIRPSCRRNSFPAGTAVLMADGTNHPIEQIRIGDTVTATDPATGATGPQRVEATIYTPDDREFTELAIATPNGSTATSTSTSHHPYWSENRQAWRDAADLVVGDTLRTPEGRTARIVSTRHWTSLQPAYNLTISSVHTYYVLAGSTPVLVHNDGGSDPKVFPNLKPEDTYGWTKLYTPGTVATRTGNYQYVVLTDGTLLIGKGDGHIALTSGADVLAAGEVRFKSGRMTEVNNLSGHYKPTGSYAEAAAVEAFGKVGIDATGKYVEYKFTEC
ncbi:polymorphic toxin-type HINT domain-containing protein, partial [Kitasatospora sp. NPDC058170]|uniref:polymorphic toxin-type HINT domain-containing protein n=1 Tax=Kitasatospora sp. NPDC058170 TaxID=3346364 RepID=UPI0036D9FA4D